MMFKQYLQVTKPGIIFGNLISVIGGFLLASKGSIDYPLFIYTLVGVSLVVASGCGLTTTSTGISTERWKGRRIGCWLKA